MPQLYHVFIRPHLIPFLYNELKADHEGNYRDKKTKLVKITQYSPLGQLIIFFMKRAEVKVVSAPTFNVCITVDADSSKNLAQLFQRGHGKTKSVMLLREDEKLLNDLIESIFRIKLVEYIKGYIKERKSLSPVKSAIHQFMLEYELYDTTLDPETLRKLYYRAIKNENSLYRLQVPVANQGLNFASA